MEYKKGCTITNPVLRNPFYSISYFSSYWKVGILNLLILQEILRHGLQ